MKKFGTPIGAGPGSDSENVGFEVLGTPLPVGSLAAGVVVLVVFFFGLLFFGVLVEGVWPWLDDFSGDEDVGCGVVLDELVVVVLLVPGALEWPGALECEGEVEVELEVVGEEDDELAEEDDEDDELELEDEELDELGGAVVVVVVVVDVDDEAAGGAQIIVSETAPGMLTGGMTPGVAVTGPTVCVPPPTRVTVIVHVSAKAIGMAARPRTTKIEAASSSTARSLRLNVKLVRPLLPPSTCASHASKFAAHRLCRGHGTDWYGGLQFRTGGFTPASHAFSRARTRVITRRPRAHRRGPHEPFLAAEASILRVKARLR